MTKKVGQGSSGLQKIARAVTQGLAAQVAFQGKGVAAEKPGSAVTAGGDYLNAALVSGQPLSDQLKAATSERFPTPLDPAGHASPLRSAKKAAKAAKAAARRLQPGVPSADLELGHPRRAEKRQDRSPHRAAARRLQQVAPTPAPAPEGSLSAFPDLAKLASMSLGQIDPGFWAGLFDTFPGVGADGPPASEETVRVWKNVINRLGAPSGRGAWDLFSAGVTLAVQIQPSNLGDQRLHGRAMKTSLALLENYQGLFQNMAAQQPETGPFPPALAGMLFANSIYDVGDTGWKSAGYEILGMSASDRADAYTALDAHFPAYANHGYAGHYQPAGEAMKSGVDAASRANGSTNKDSCLETAFSSYYAPFYQTAEGDEQPALKDSAGR